MNCATEALQKLERITVEELSQIDVLEKQKLLLPKDVKIEFNEHNQVVTHGLDLLDNKQKDLLSYIRIIDPLHLKYVDTGVLMPRTYAESLTPIPEHISVQCLVFSLIDEEAARFINETNKKKMYGKTDYDRFIISVSENKKFSKGDVVFIMNRRIGGWDGSIDCPAIELLGAGGHLAVHWDERQNKFVSADFIENLQREFYEELKIFISKENFSIFGGFHNEKSNELVVLCGAFINCPDIEIILEQTQNNISEDIDGIYVGDFDEIMEMYEANAESFAGGNKAKPTNFPSQKDLMKIVSSYIKSKKLK